MAQQKTTAKKTTPKTETQTVEKKETPKKPQLLHFRKISGGSIRLRIDGKLRMIKPNEEFTALRSDIPEAFVNLLECLDGPLDPAKKDFTVEPGEVKKAVYTLKPAEGSASDNPTFDIVDENGKKINEEPLTDEKASETIKALE